MIVAITRAFTLLYTATLITLLTRVQLNLLGRKEYLSSVLTLASRSRDSSDPRIGLEKQPSSGDSDSDDVLAKQYLAFSWWLLNRGWRDLKSRVEAATKQIFGPLTPRDTITLGRFRQLAMEVRRLVETPQDQEIAWLPFLLPPRDEEPNVLALSGVDQLSPSPELRRLLDETSDILESPTAATVLAHMLAVGFELLIDGKLAQRAFMPKTAAPPPPPPPSPEDQSGEFEIAHEVADDAATKFASVLAALKNLAPAIGTGKENEFLAVSYHPPPEDDDEDG
jgi:peroxin-3